MKTIAAAGIGLKAALKQIKKQNRREYLRKLWDAGEWDRAREEELALQKEDSAQQEMEKQRGNYLSLGDAYKPHELAMMRRNEATERGDHDGFKRYQDDYTSAFEDHFLDQVRTAMQMGDLNQLVSLYNDMQPVNRVQGYTLNDQGGADITFADGSALNLKPGGEIADAVKGLMTNPGGIYDTLDQAARLAWDRPAPKKGRRLRDANWGLLQSVERKT